VPGTNQIQYHRPLYFHHPTSKFFCDDIESLILVLVIDKRDNGMIIQQQQPIPLIDSHFFVGKEDDIPSLEVDVPSLEGDVPLLASETPLSLPRSSLLLASSIGSYQYSEPDPDDPFAEPTDGGDIVSCDVNLDGQLSSWQDTFRDKLQRFRFQDFDGGLTEFMEARRPGIEANDPKVLAQVHERFRHVVQTIIVDHKLYASVLGKQGDFPQVVAPFATPNVRLGRGRYTGFLHSDATFAAPRNFAANSTSPRAMMNIWMCLNDTPPNNQLAFYHCPKHYTSLYYGKLVGQRDHIEGQTLVYDYNMSWGSFYCFVAGESNDASSVLLHGAVDIPSSGKQQRLPQRKSVELRYVV